MGIVLGLFQIWMFAIEEVVMYSDFIAKLYKSQSLTAVKKAPQLEATTNPSHKKTDSFSSLNVSTTFNLASTQ